MERTKISREKKRENRHRNWRKSVLVINKKNNILIGTTARRADKGGIQQNYYETIWYDDFYCKNTLIFIYSQQQQEEKNKHSVSFTSKFYPFFWYACWTRRRNAPATIYCCWLAWFWSKWSKPNLNGHASYTHCFLTII